MRKTLLSIVLGVAVLLAGCGPTAQPASEGDTERAIAWFEQELEEIRQELRIPGLSAAIVQDQELIWARGFGYADLENQVPATLDTPYRLASVTKPIAATLIMQLVEQGVLDLDDPVDRYGVHVESEGVVRVRHLLTHTSEGVPGTRHHYDGGRYGLLGQVIEGATGRSFAELLSERVLEPLEWRTARPATRTARSNRSSIRRSAALEIAITCASTAPWPGPTSSIRRTTSSRGPIAPGSTPPPA